MFKRPFLLVGAALLAVLLWSLAGRGTNTSYEAAQEMLMFRRIGHEFLLSVGDTRSRVMPVEKISEKEFRIEFENPFAFQTDSLIDIVGRILPKQSQNYIVNVTDRKNREVVYSFAYPVVDNSTPCLNRAQPKRSYALNILLSSAPPVAKSKTIPVMVSGMLAICLAFFAWRFTKKDKPVIAPVADTPFIAIGKLRFYPDRHLLQFEENPIGLTAKETKLLRIFSQSPNEVIDRNQLLKEGWEDEGVITGRSLDMFVSKLRKKLQDDPAISIINVHGKGYRLSC